MSDDELLQATLLALTMQNVTGDGGNPPQPTPVGPRIDFFHNISKFVEWPMNWDVVTLYKVNL